METYLKKLVSHCKFFACPVRLFALQISIIFRPGSVLEDFVWITTLGLFLLATILNIFELVSMTHSAINIISISSEGQGLINMEAPHDRILHFYIHLLMIPW